MKKVLDTNFSMFIYPVSYSLWVPILEPLVPILDLGDGLIVLLYLKLLLILLLHTPRVPILEPPAPILELGDMNSNVNELIPVGFNY